MNTVYDQDLEQQDWRALAGLVGRAAAWALIAVTVLYLTFALGVAHGAHRLTGRVDCDQDTILCDDEGA